MAVSVHWVSSRLVTALRAAIPVLNLTWPNVTIVPFLAEPDKFMVLKPEITKRMARRMGFDLLYSSEPTWHTFEALQRMARMLLDRLGPLGAKDFIDVQSFIWVTKDIE